MAWLSSPPDPITESVSSGRASLLAVGAGLAVRYTWKIEDSVKVYRGMTEAAAKDLVDTLSELDGHHAVARRSNEAGGWEVRDEIHSVTFVGSERSDGSSASSGSSS